MNEKFVRAALLQFSGIVGAGIFALPFVLYNSNFYFSVWGMFLIAIITGIINFLYIQIICNTKGDHQLPGYTKEYLGTPFKCLASVSLIISGLGAELAYIKLGSSFLNVLFSVKSFLSVLVFLFLALAGYLVKSKKIKKFLGFLPFAAIFLALLLLQITFKNQFSNVETSAFNWSFFGVCVFALSGFTILPEVEEILRSENNKEKKVVLASILGLFMAFFVYFIFSYSVIRISGNYLSENSIDGITKVSQMLGVLISIFGILVTFKGATNFMIVFHEIFYRDFGVSDKTANVLAIVLPVISLSLFNLPFTSLLGWIGSGSIFLSVIIICLIRLKLNKSKLTWVLVFLVLSLFVLGFIAMI